MGSGCGRWVVSKILVQTMKGKCIKPGLMIPSMLGTKWTGVINSPEWNTMQSIAACVSTQSQLGGLGQSR